MNEANEANVEIGQLVQVGISFAGSKIMHSNLLIFFRAIYLTGTLIKIQTFFNLSEFLNVFFRFFLFKISLHMGFTTDFLKRFLF